MHHDQFELFIANKDYSGVAFVAANSPDNMFRSAEALQRLREVTRKGGNLFGNPLLIYFPALIKHASTLNQFETIEYLKLLDLKQQAKKVESLF
jgi:hypothetical protein